MCEISIASGQQRVLKSYFPLHVLNVNFFIFVQKLGHLLLAIDSGNLILKNSIPHFTFPSYINEYSLHILAYSRFLILYILYISVLFTPLFL